VIYNPGKSFGTLQMVFVFTSPSPTQYNDDILHVTKKFYFFPSSEGEGWGGRGLLLMGVKQKYMVSFPDKIESISVFLQSFTVTLVDMW